MVSSTAYYIKFDGFSPTFFNQFLVVEVHTREFFVISASVKHAIVKPKSSLK
jgi:hypothetical protein